MAKQTVYEMIPQLGKLRDEVLFGDVWEQPELSKRDRSLVTCSVWRFIQNTGARRSPATALDNGVTIEELKGMITHVAFYSDGRQRLMQDVSCRRFSKKQVISENHRIL